MGVRRANAAVLSRCGRDIGKELGGPQQEKTANGTNPQAKELDFNKLCGTAVARLGISSAAFYQMDAMELFWTYKVWRDDGDALYQDRYEVARFLGIMIKNPKLLPRLRSVLPFVWERLKGENKPTVSKKQTVAEQKAVMMGIVAACEPRKKKKRGVRTPPPKRERK